VALRLYAKKIIRPLQGNKQDGKHLMPVANNDSLIGDEQIILILKTIYTRSQSEETPELNIADAIDLTLN